MRSTLLPWPLALLTLVAAPAQDAKGVRFAADYASALAEAATARKRVFVLFVTEWAAPCRRLAAEVWPDAGLARTIAARFVAVRVDKDAEPALALRFGVDGVPACLIVDPQQALWMRVDGAEPIGTPASASAWFERAASLLAAHDELRAEFDRGEAKVRSVAEKLVESLLAIDARARAATAWNEHVEALGQGHADEIDVRLRAVALYLAADAVEDAALHHERLAELLPEGHPRHGELLACGDAFVVKHVAGLLAAGKDEQAAEAIRKQRPAMIAGRRAAAIALTDALAECTWRDSVRRYGRDLDESLVRGRMRAHYLELKEPFAEHELVGEILFKSADLAYGSGAREAALAEMQALAAHPRAGEWAQRARERLAAWK